MHLMQRMVLPAILCSLPIATPCSFAEDWPYWRGPNHEGVSAETGLPGAINLETDLAWSIELPGRSSSTPIVSGGRIFVVSNGKTRSKMFALCVNAHTGEVLWEKLLDSVQGDLSDRNDMASASPVTDGETVYFMAGTGVLRAYTFDGDERWSVSLTERYLSLIHI